MKVMISKLLIISIAVFVISASAAQDKDPELERRLFLNKKTQMKRIPKNDHKGMDLLGTAMGPGGKIAVIDGKSLMRGDTIKGYIVTDIKHEQAVLKKGDEELTLTVGEGLRWILEEVDGDFIPVKTVNWDWSINNKESTINSTFTFRNNTDLTVSGISLELKYSDEFGRTIYKDRLKALVEIPPWRSSKYKLTFKLDTNYKGTLSELDTLWLEFKIKKVIFGDRTYWESQ